MRRTPRGTGVDVTPGDGDRSRSADRYLLDRPLTVRLETVLRVMTDTLAFPTARVNIVSDQLQHTIRMFGDGDQVPIPRQEAFCDTVVRTGHPVVVDDAVNDPRFATFPGVLSGEIGSYLGVPLIGRESMVIGALCLVDPAPQTTTSHQLTLLIQFKKIIEELLDKARSAHEQQPA